MWPLNNKCKKEVDYRIQTDRLEEVIKFISNLPRINFVILKEFLLKMGSNEPHFLVAKRGIEPLTFGL